MLCLDFSHFQSLDDFQPTVVLSRIRRLKPTVYNHSIGELFLYRNFLITHGRDDHPKVLSSACNSTGAETESTRVATLSNVFEKPGEFHVWQRLYVS